MSDSEAKQTRRLVVKIGSSSLMTSKGDIAADRLDDFAAQLAEVRAHGFQPVVVSSGAIACGVKRLGFAKRPEDLPSLQAAASVGQVEFVGAWAQALRDHGMESSLILLTRRDTADRASYLHARDTIDRLLELGVVPIVNENDTVSVEEMSFGENDTLSALVSCLIGADKCIILSDIDGLYDANPQVNLDAKLIKRVDHIDQSILAVAGDAGSSVGTGGMATKLRAARTLGIAGIPLVICNASQSQSIVDAALGNEVGTLFVASKLPHEITPRKLWIALGDSPRGTLTVDEGAKRALIKKGSSLLMVGVAGATGKFTEGDLVDIMDEDGFRFARGLITADADAVELAVGKTHDELAHNHLLAHLATRELIHRDNLVIYE